MDYLKSFYTCEVRVSVNPDQVVRIRWYKAPDGAKVLPTSHAFGNGPGLESGAREYPTPDLGQTDLARLWDKGLTPAGVTGQSTPTPLEWYRNGVPPEALLNPPAPECVMDVDLTNTTVTLGPTGIVVGGPGAVTINPPAPPATAPPPVTINIPVTINGPFIVGGPFFIPVVAPVDPVDGNLWMLPASCELKYRCGGATKTVSTVGGPAQLPTAAPANPVDGSMYLNATDCTLRVWCGGGWKTFSPLSGPAVIPPSEPSSPLLGSVYSDPGNNVCKLWNGSAWLEWTLVGSP